MALRLFLCKLRKSGSVLSPSQPSLISRASGLSILITSAPQSVNWRTQVGPERTLVRSITLNLDKGPRRVWFCVMVTPYSFDAQVKSERNRSFLY